MKLPRDVSGEDLALRLRPYGYEVSRQIGSHIQLTSRIKSAEHHVTIPAHRLLKVGTLSAILGAVALYLEKERTVLVEELFGR